MRTNYEYKGIESGWGEFNFNFFLKPDGSIGFTAYSDELIVNRVKIALSRVEFTLRNGQYIDIHRSFRRDSPDFNKVKEVSYILLTKKVVDWLQVTGTALFENNHISITSFLVDADIVNCKEQLTHKIVALRKELNDAEVQLLKINEGITPRV
jgi:hypothetical protein